MNTAHSHPALEAAAPQADLPHAGVEIIDDYFNESGSPAPRRCGEKPADYFNTPNAQVKRKRGRPTKFTADAVERLVTLLSIGFSRRQAAAHLGIDAGAITHAVARDAKFGDRVRQAEERSALLPQGRVLAAARKHWRAAACVLTQQERTKTR